MIIALRHDTYDGSMTFYFTAPDGTTQEGFKALCDGLIRECAREAVARYKAGSRLIIGYEYLVMDVAKKLPSYGYQECKLPTASYRGGLILSCYNGDEDNNVLGQELTAEVVAVNEAFHDYARGRSREPS